MLLLELEHRPHPYKVRVRPEWYRDTDKNKDHTIEEYSLVGRQ